MRYKAKPNAAQTSSGDCIQPMAFKANLFPFFPGPLSENPIIVRGTGGLKLKRSLFPLIVKPVERFFIFVGVDGLVQDIFSAACGNQQKNVMANGTECYRLIKNLWNLF